MARYSVERKEAVLKKLLPPFSRPVPEVALEEGISEQTLYNWLKRLREEGKPVPQSGQQAEQWSPQTKFAVVVETAGLSEVELSQYCREKGLLPEQVREWKAACIAGNQTVAEQRKADREQTKADRKRIRELERELRRKDAALAEAAALLVLRKKLRALYGEEDGDD